MTIHRRHDISEPLLQRVCSEFLEMPGLRITGKQAQRLWGLDEQTCLRVLEYLVDAKFLWRQSHGLYARLTEGSVDLSRLRMVKASLDDPISMAGESAHVNHGQLRS